MQPTAVGKALCWPYVNYGGHVYLKESGGPCLYMPLSPPPGLPCRGGEASEVLCHPTHLRAASASAMKWLVHALLCMASKSAVSPATSVCLGSGGQRNGVEGLPQGNAPCPATLTLLHPQLCVQLVPRV